MEELAKTATKNDPTKELIILGTYTKAQGDILKSELEKNNIPVQVFNPAIRMEHLGREEWLASSISIPKIKLAEAIEICKKMNLPFDAKPESNQKSFFGWIVLLIFLLGLAIIIYYYLR